jgi:hypothetical protein
MVRSADSTRRPAGEGRDVAGGDLATFVTKPLVYVAAPYSRPDPVENTHRLIKFVDLLVDEGLVTPIAPHLTMLWHVVTPRPIEFWYSYDIAILARCDAVYRIEGESVGADREVAYAQDLSLPVFHAVADLNEWASGR